MARPSQGGRKACIARKRAAGICTCCPEPALPGLSKCRRCKDRDNASRLLRHAKLKDEVFEAYGGYKCACCGESHREFLHIDHKNGDGAAHRRSMGDPTGANMYAWLKKHKFPDGFQVLCANCNWSRGRYGYCPHQKGHKNEPSWRFVTPAEMIEILEER